MSYTIEELTENRCGDHMGERLTSFLTAPSVHDEVYLITAVRSFKGVDIALFSAGGSISKKLGPVAAAAGAIVSGRP